MTGRQFLGVLFFSLGALIMGLSGMCTFGVVVGGLDVVFKNLFEGRILEIFQAALLPLVVGGIPFLIGWGLWALGRRIAGSNSHPVGPFPKEEVVPSSQDDVKKMNKEIE